MRTKEILELVVSKSPRFIGIVCKASLLPRGQLRSQPLVQWGQHRARHEKNRPSTCSVELHLDPGANSMVQGIWELLRAPFHLAWCCDSLGCKNIFAHRCHIFLGQRISSSRLSDAGGIQHDVVGTSHESFTDFTARAVTATCCVTTSPWSRVGW